MKLFAWICALAAVMTAAVNHRILNRFGTMYAKLTQELLPGPTRILLWQGGALPTGLLLASSAVVLAGLLRKNNRWMLAGGIASMVLMLGAATIVPAALLIPVSQVLPRMDHAPPPPGPRKVPAGGDSIGD